MMNESARQAFSNTAKVISAALPSLDIDILGEDLSKLASRLQERSSSEEHTFFKIHIVTEFAVLAFIVDRIKDGEVATIVSKQLSDNHYASENSFNEHLELRQNCLIDLTDYTIEANSAFDFYEELIREEILIPLAEGSPQKYDRAALAAISRVFMVASIAPNLPEDSDEVFFQISDNYRAASESEIISPDPKSIFGDLVCFLFITNRFNDTPINKSLVTKAWGHQYDSESQMMEVLRREYDSFGLCLDGREADIQEGYQFYMTHAQSFGFLD